MNIPQKFWNTVMALVAVLTLFVAILGIKSLREISYVGSNPDVTSTISVDGTGDAIAVPDIATFSFSVTQTAKTVNVAQEAATTKINAALKAVREAGVADKDISTESYSINPHYEYQTVACSTGSYCPGKNVLTGYDVSQSISVKVRELSKAGEIFASIGSLGVQNVNGLSFSVDKPESVQAEARAKAITNARAKASILADKLGVSLGRIVSFTEGGASPRPMMYAMTAKAGAMDSAAVAPEIPAGEQKVTSTVSITYEIK